MRRTNRIVIAATLLATIGLASACRTFNVRTDWDDEHRFVGLERFSFVEPPEQPGSSPFADNSLLRKRIRRAVVETLEARGFAEVPDRDAADFLVTYGVLLDERLRVDGVQSTVGTGFRRPYLGVGFQSSTNVREYQESTLIIDLLDRESEALVWRGWGTGIVGTRDRNRGEERLREGVAAILKRFPPEGAAGAKGARGGS